MAANASFPTARAEEFSCVVRRIAPRLWNLVVIDPMGAGEKNRQDDSPFASDRKGHVMVLMDATPDRVDVGHDFSGDHRASELLSLVYAQLRSLAQQRLNHERVGHTLTATALVHEAYLRLSEGRRIPWGGEAHFYVAAAEAMRRILLDHARSKGRLKRGGGRKCGLINVLDLAAEQDSEEILALEQHLCRLEIEHPEAAAVIHLRFFAGLTIDQTAEVLGLSPRQVNRLWTFARAWMFRALQDDS